MKYRCDCPTRTIDIAGSTGILSQFVYLARLRTICLWILRDLGYYASQPHATSRCDFSVCSLLKVIVCPLSVTRTTTIFLITPLRPRRGAPNPRQHTAIHRCTQHILLEICTEHLKFYTNIFFNNKINFADYTLQIRVCKK